ncbi:MAG: hypothetical protein ACRDKH_00530 [Solirubrobacterales bacterium]
MTEAAATGHTCGRCEVTASWMDGVSRPEPPSGWVVEGSEVFCLNCRRERAAESIEVDEDVPAAERTKLRSQARIEFEIRRDPTLPDNRIAKSCRTSTMAVRKARVRIGVPGPGLN